MRTTRVPDNGALRSVIEAARRNGKASLKALTVLSPQVDPYRLDTEAGHRDGRWLAEHMGRLGYLDGHRRIHLRGLHYALVVTGDVVKPNGEVYRNTADDWEWLQEHASKKARWLRYVPFESIIDARNSEPVINRRAAATPRPFINIGLDVYIPAVDELTPTVGIAGFEARQPYHLVIYGEKTSLEDVLGPIARRYGADLYLPSGEISDSQLYQMARDGAEDGRPMVVFSFADADPSGRQMAVSIGRKLQALRDLMFPELEFEVWPAALTVEQVKELDLPSTPLKDTERRADAWRQAFGVEQTEIDALAAIRPDLLRRIAEDAIAPFYDPTLRSRVNDALDAWRVRAQAALDRQVSAELLDELRADAEEKLGRLEAEIEAINEALRTATDDLDLDLPLVDIPSPIITEPAGTPLIASRWDWSTASRALLNHKAYGNGEDRP